MKKNKKENTSWMKNRHNCFFFFLYIFESRRILGELSAADPALSFPPSFSEREGENRKLGDL